MFTEQEKNLLVRMLDQMHLKATDPEAAGICALVASILAKLAVENAPQKEG